MFVPNEPKSRSVFDQLADTILDLQSIRVAQMNAPLKGRDRDRLMSGQRRAMDLIVSLAGRLDESQIDHLRKLGGGSMSPATTTDRLTWGALVDREPGLLHAERLAARGGSERDWLAAKGELEGLVGSYRPQSDELATPTAYEVAYRHCRAVFERASVASRQGHN